MGLEQIFYQPNVTEMLVPVMGAAGLNFTRDYCFDNEGTLRTLVEQGYLVRPEFNGEHPRYKASKIVDQIQKLGERPLIIPHNSELFPDMAPGRIVKRGKLVKLRRVRTLEDAVNQQITPEKLREEAFRQVKIDNAYVGYDWKGIGETNKSYKVVRLVDCVNGVLLHENSNRDEQLRLKSYDDCEQAIFRGAHAVVDVPSVSKEEADSYRVRLSSLPVYNVIVRGRGKPRKLYFATWFDLSSNHSCGKKDYAFQYVREGREGTEGLFDFHDIAAYLRVMEHKYRTGSYIRIMVNPFATPTELGMDFARKLQTQVLREHIVNGKIRRRPLNQAEQEILLWKLVALRKSAFN